jgi:hypothetical protein
MPRPKGNRPPVKEIILKALRNARGQAYLAGTMVIAVVSISMALALAVPSIGRSDPPRVNMIFATDKLPSFEFRGHRIGEYVGDKFRYWTEGTKTRGSFCSPEQPSKTMICTGDPRDEPDAGSYFGKVNVTLNYEFLSKKLRRMTMGFDVRSLAEINNIVIKEYGPPDIAFMTLRTFPVGIVTESPTSQWLFKEGVLVLEYGSPSAMLSFDPYVPQ